MNWRKNRMAIGALAFCVLLGLTLWAVKNRNRPPRSAEELPSVELEKDAITSLEIDRPKSERVILSKVDGVWRVTEPLDVPADQGNVESALNRLADLEIERVVANRPEHYARLQVDDENAVRVLVKGGDDDLAKLSIGKYSNGMTMLRVGERTEVFGASGSLRYAFARELKSWRDRKVVSIEPGDVQMIRFDSPNGTFELHRQGEGWTAAESRKAIGELDPKQVTGIVSTAARLIASDFAPSDTSAARAGLTEPKATVTLQSSQDPEAVVLELGDRAGEGDDLYLRRKGTPTIYVISKYLADRLQPRAESFQTPPAAPPAAATGAQQQPQLPPEVMKQLREQIRAQQQQGQR